MTDAYSAAGVSIEAGDKAVELMKTWVEKASRPEVIGGIGGFGGLWRFGRRRCRLRGRGFGRLHRRSLDSGGLLRLGWRLGWSRLVRAGGA